MTRLGRWIAIGSAGLLSAMIWSAPIGAACNSPALSPRAARLVRPLLEEFFTLHAADRDSAVPLSRHGRVGPIAADRSRDRLETLDSLFEDHVDRLLDRTGPAADEAIAALTCFYIGEWPAEAIECEAINRHRTIVPYLKRFRLCPPKTGLEPIAPFFLDVPNMREEILDRITAGETECDFDD